MPVSRQPPASTMCSASHSGNWMHADNSTENAAVYRRRRSVQKPHYTYLAAQKILCKRCEVTALSRMCTVTASCSTTQQSPHVLPSCTAHPPKPAGCNVISCIPTPFILTTTNIVYFYSCKPRPVGSRAVYSPHHATTRTRAQSRTHPKLKVLHPMESAQLPKP